MAGVPGAPSVITQEIVDLIAEANPGSTIKIAIYFVLDETPATDGADEIDRIAAAVRAAVLAKGVTVIVVTDSVSDDDVRVTDAQDDLESAGAVIRKCSAGCFTGSGAIMHNKFMTLTDVGGTPVVAQMSANWSNKQLRDFYYNNMVVIRGDQALFNTYNTYWGQLSSCAVSSCPATYPTQGGGGDAGSETFVHFFPRSTTTSDPPLSEIENVTCPGSEIDVVMGSWTTNNPRPLEIRDTLLAQRADGCTVRLVVPRSEPIATGGYMDAFQDDARCTGPQPVSHSKFMLVDGTYSGVAESRIVFTGSHNFTYGAWRENDEAWLKIDSAGGSPANNVAVFGAYLQNFEQMWNLATPCQDL